MKWQNGQRRKIYGRDYVYPATHGLWVTYLPSFFHRRGFFWVPPWQRSDQLQIFQFFLPLLKYWSPLWALPSNLILPHSFRSLSTACQFLIPIIFESSLTSPFYLTRGLRRHWITRPIKCTHLCSYSFLPCSRNLWRNDNLQDSTLQFISTSIASPQCGHMNLTHARASVKLW